MKVYAVIERDEVGSEKIIGLFQDLDEAFEVSGSRAFYGLFRKISRSVEVMRVEGKAK